MDLLPFAVVLLVAVLLADRQLRRLFHPKEPQRDADVQQLRDELKELQLKQQKTGMTVNQLALNAGFKGENDRPRPKN